MVSFSLDERIHLREVAPADADAIFDAVMRNYDHLERFMHWITPDYTRQSVDEFIERSILEREERRTLGFGIFDDQDFIGSIGFVNFDWAAKKTELGYWISKTHEGRGIVSSACRRLIRLAIEELDINRIEIHCSIENARSAAIPERLGFTREGVLRQAVLRNGRLHDFAIYGLLAAEWSDPARSKKL